MHSIDFHLILFDKFIRIGARQINHFFRFGIVLNLLLVIYYYHPTRIKHVLFDPLEAPRVIIASTLSHSESCAHSHHEYIRFARARHFL